MLVTHGLRSRNAPATLQRDGLASGAGEKLALRCPVLSHQLLLFHEGFELLAPLLGKKVLAKMEVIRWLDLYMSTHGHSVAQRCLRPRESFTKLGGPPCPPWAFPRLLMVNVPVLQNARKVAKRSPALRWTGIPLIRFNHCTTFQTSVAIMLHS